MELHSHPATDLFSTIDVSTIDVSFGRVVTVADANVPLRLDNRELTNDKRKIKNQKILIMEDNEEMKLKKKKKKKKKLVSRVSRRKSSTSVASNGQPMVIC